MDDMGSITDKPLATTSDGQRRLRALRIWDTKEQPPMRGPYRRPLSNPDWPHSKAVAVAATRRDLH
ncbi:hypothetical protein CHELA1G11_10336 [Hyphomicrobiales bacterium]|nr:hypothetical protein CHELA1G11_10336 [Hyphomicrobiales bacterium]CAH1675393.1 hypothetical protein CHELA1G2_13969 [Hyphomicrobiales bacterium]